MNSPPVRINERKVLCCSGSAAVKTIAILQTIVFAGGFILLIAALTIMFLNGDEAREEFQRQLGQLGTDEKYPLATIYILILTALIHTLVVGILTGLALLKGVKEKSPQLMKFWMAFAAASMIFGLISVTVTGVAFGSVWASVAGTLGHALYALGIWIVFRHIKDLEQHRSRAGIDFKI